MITFNGKPEKFELFEGGFQTRLRIQYELTKESKLSSFHSFKRDDSPHTFMKISSQTGKKEEMLTVFREKNLNRRSMRTVKHKYQLVFNPVNQKVIDSWDELQKLSKVAFEFAARANIEQFSYAKIPPHLKKSINQAHLKNGTYERIITSWKGIRVEQFEGPRRIWNEHCDATCHKTKPWKA